MRSTTLDELERLSAVLRTSPPSPLIQQAIHKLYEYERANLASQLAEIERDIRGFEERQGMTSTEFLAQYQRGEVGDDADAFEWAAFCKMKTSLEERLRMLEVATGE
jgi:hypothetical protein